MTYERDEAMRQQEATEALIGMREPQGSRPQHRRDGMPHRMEPHTVGDTDADHVQHSIAISLKRIADALHGDETNSGIMHALFDIAQRTNFS